MTMLFLILRRMGGMLFRPARTGAEIARDPRLRAAAILVTSFGLWYSLMFYLSHLARDYPPPPEVFSVWVEHWGSFAMLPVLPVPIERYRLFLAVISLPLALLMRARDSCRADSCRADSYKTYFSITAFGFFTFWLLSALFDMGYNALLGPDILPALNGDYGPGWHAFYLNFPALEYTILYGLAGLNIGLAAHAAERALAGRASPGLAILRAALIGFAAFAWPTLLIAVVVR